jgi:TPR repeat protein
MADIFISYAREDEATAQRLRDVLASQGWDVWRDKEGIVTGSAWGTSIENALRDAKCVVVLWSTHALSSHFVRDEAEIGRNANKLVPVQIGDVQLPIGFRGIQTANLMHWDGELDHPEYRKLVSAIGDRVGAAHVSGDARPPDVGPLRRIGAMLQRLVARPQFPYVAGGAAVAVLALWVAARVWSGGDPHDALEQGLKNYFDTRYVEAEAQLRSAAQHNSGLAAYYMAAMYFNGNGVKQDDAKALEWALRGARLGDVHAQNYVGYLLGSGRGAKQDHEQALRWYLAAADQGFGLSAYNAGLAYANGEGTHTDPQKAVEYYRRAVDQGEGLAGNALGDMYRYGRGVGLDMNRAVYWYKLGANKGDAAASANLGYMYANGQGVAVDDQRALALYRHAADLNNASAINNLGYMYENGRGVTVDLNAALSFYRRAAELGERTAVANVARVQERMRTPGRR